MEETERELADLKVAEINIRNARFRGDEIVFKAERFGRTETDSRYYPCVRNQVKYDQKLADIAKQRRNIQLDQEQVMRDAQFSYRQELMLPAAINQVNEPRTATGTQAARRRLIRRREYSGSPSKSPSTVSTESDSLISDTDSGTTDLESLPELADIFENVESLRVNSQPILLMLRLAPRTLPVVPVHEVLWPAAKEIVSALDRQHIPQSYEAAKKKTKALKVEMQGAALHSPSYSQALTFFCEWIIPTDALARNLTLYSKFEERDDRIQDLANPVLLVSGKNYKLQLRGDNPVSVIQSTFESCARVASKLPRPSNSSSDEVLLYLELIQTAKSFNRSCGKENTSIYCNSLLNQYTDGTIEFSDESYAARWGLKYLQVYSVVKELFDASKIFPFMSKNLDGLAMDPITMRDLYTVGGGRALHYATPVMQQSQGSGYGTRIEVRISARLAKEYVYHSIRQGHNTNFPYPQSLVAYPLPSNVYLDYLASNLRKFMLALARQQRGGGFVAHDNLKVARAMLQLLRICEPLSKKFMFKLNWYPFGPPKSTAWKRNKLASRENRLAQKNHSTAHTSTTSGTPSAWRPAPYEADRIWDVYAALKTQYEQEIWKFGREEKPSSVINSVLPCFVVGPIFHAKQPGSTGKWVMDFWKDPGYYEPLQDFGASWFVAERDRRILEEEKKSGGVAQPTLPGLGECQDVLGRPSLG
ncbi:hypothetical protein V1527DRAFT_454772 [Lipomyces starkeyi]